MIHMAVGTQLSADTLKVISADGLVVATSADFFSPMVTLVDQQPYEKIFEMNSVAAKRIQDYCISHVGQKLTIQMKSAGAQTLEIYWRLKHLSVAVAYTPPPAATQK